MNYETFNFRIRPTLWLPKFAGILAAAGAAAILIYVGLGVCMEPYSEGWTRTNPLIMIPVAVVNLLLTFLISLKRLKRLHFLHLLGDVFVPMSFYSFVVSLKSIPHICLASILLFLVVSVVIVINHRNLIRKKLISKSRYPQLMLMDIKTALWFAMAIPFFWSLG